MVSQAFQRTRVPRTTARGWCRGPASCCRRCTLTLLLWGNGVAVRHRLLAPDHRICGVYLHLPCRLWPRPPAHMILARSGWRYTGFGP